VEKLSPKGWNIKPVVVEQPLEPIELGRAGCSTSTRHLAEADLARSGLSLADAAAFGIHIIDDASALDPGFRPRPALAISYFDLQGVPLTYQDAGVPRPFCRVRYLTDSGWRVGKSQRYAQPAGTGTPIYLPRGLDWSDGALRACGGVVLTEGEKKAAALCSQGIRAIAVGGVFNFSDKAAAAPLHADLVRIAKAAGEVSIVFDSDAAEKPAVLEAERRLAGQIAAAGGRPHVVRLPPAHDGSKVGADDFLVAHGAAALLDLINAAPVVGAEDLAASGEIVSLADLLAGEVKPVPELIPDWLQKGIVTFLAGQGGVHKSRLALQIGLCLNAGVLPPGLGGAQRAQIDRGPIATLVYVSAEDGVDELRRRAQGIAGQLRLKRPKGDRALIMPRDGKDCALVVIQEGGKADVQPFYHELTELLRTIPGHKLVVLDSAYDFARWTGKTKVEEDAVNWYVKTFLKGICDQCDATLLIPWHPSQAGSERDDMSGWSVAWHNAPRARWGLKAARDVEDAFELSVTKRSHGRKAEPVLLRFHEGALLPAIDIPDDGKAALARKAVVAAALKAAEVGTPLTQQRTPPGWVLTEVSKACGRSVSGREVKDQLQCAVADGDLIYRQGHGKVRAGYFPPEGAGVMRAQEPDDGGSP
jgi:hypothetical protein